MGHVSTVFTDLFCCHNSGLQFSSSATVASSVNEGALLEVQHASSKDGNDAVTVRLMVFQVGIVRRTLASCLRFDGGRCGQHLWHILFLVLFDLVFSSVQIGRRGQAVCRNGRRLRGVQGVITNKRKIQSSLSLS